MSQPKMTSCRTLVLLGAVAASLSMVDAAVANADYIDFGTNQAACNIAAKQANAASSRYSYCYETGPQHYSLYLAN
jgi:hypothetical protein